MNRSTAATVHPMLIVDCPLCDDAAPLDDAAGTLTCDHCLVTMDLAPDPCPVLAVAA